MNQHSTIAAGLLASILALAATQPASATPGPTMRVSYKHSELRTDEGAQAVFSRIRRSANRACAAGGWNSHYRTVYKCRNELVELAVAKLNNPRVAGVHAANKPVRMASLR